MSNKEHDNSSGAEEEEEEVIVEKKETYSKIGNLESIKRSFYNNEMDAFKAGVTPFKLYVADYFGADEFDGKPAFIIKNRNKGFVQSLDSKRAYLFVAFKCYKENDSVVFRRYWIINSIESLEKILPDEYNFFIFSQVVDVEDFLSNFIVKTVII